MQYLAIDKKNDSAYFIRYAWDVSHAANQLKSAVKLENLFDFSFESVPFKVLFYPDSEIENAIKNRTNEKIIVKFIDYK